MLHYDNMSIEIPEWDAELRLTVDGKVQLTDVSHYTFALPIIALAWKERGHWMKGWR